MIAPEGKYMPKKLATDFEERLLRHVAQHGDGVGIDLLHSAFKSLVSRRTLQRQLAHLVAVGSIVAYGEGKARMYRIASAQAPGLDAAEAYVQVSNDGAEIRALVQRPIQQRTPVAYDRAFLESYEPGVTYYLPRELSAHLSRLGGVHEAEKRPAGTHARSILDRLLIDLSWASSRLEGNTYSRLDTKNLIEFGRAAEGKDRTEAQMVLNHKVAIEMLVDNADSIGFNRFTFLNLHAALSDNLLSDPGESGRLRLRQVQISGTVFQPLGIPQQIAGYFDMILEKAGAIEDPFEQAFFVMVHIPYLQAFVDVNKRVSRLGANISLIKRNLCPLSFIDVPERAYIQGTLGVYELGRIELLRDVFLWAYERSCHRYTAIKETVAEPDPVRLQFREHLYTIVSDVVRRGDQPERSELEAVATSIGVPQDVLSGFVDMVLSDLDGLHEGNVARYRLRLTEYQTWRKKTRKNG